MKTIHILKSAAFALMLMALTGCKAEEPLPVQPDIEATVLEFPRINSFQEVACSGHPDWTVTEYPDWAVPMEESGSGSKPIELFIETNDQNEDRSSTITVSHSDGSQTVYSILQHGAFTDMDNGSSIGKRDLVKTYGVGYSINVFTTSQNEKYSVSAMSPLNHARLEKAISNYGETEGMSDEERYYSRVETVTGSSTSSIANQLSINAGIEVGISGFKGSIEGGYSQSSDSNEKYEYALEEIQHIVGSRQLRPGLLRYFAENEPLVFQRSFLAYRDSLAKDPTNTYAMRYILNNYGTHVITQGSLGGELKLSMQMKVTEENSSSGIHAALGLGTKVVNAEGEFKMNSTEEAVASNTTISLVTYGGNNVYTIAPGTTFEQFQKEVKDPDKLEQWVNGIKGNKDDDDEAKASRNLALIDIETIPIYELMADEASREALRNYMVGPYQTEMYNAQGNTFAGPDLYVLQDFILPDDMESSVYIPDIDIEVLACRVKMKELSETEYSTIIYSGNKNNVNRNTGFFVGSDTRKPCKFKRQRDGKLKIEQFDRLSPKALTELYIDATGDITISPKGATDLYRTVSFTSWKTRIDLSTVTSSTLEISEPTTLSGTRTRSGFLKVKLKNGVSITLDNANFYGQIICEGSAFIEVAASTVNKITTYLTEEEATDSDPLMEIRVPAAIELGRAGSKLILSGDGELTVLGRSVGIGWISDGTGGEVSINVGQLNAIGIYGPGIGALSYNVYSLTEIGNIAINGGRVYARNVLERSAAIGNGVDASNMDIFISRNVSEVRAIRCFGVESIGIGIVGGCGFITIEDRTKVFEEVDQSQKIPL